MIGKNYSRGKSGWCFWQLRQACSARRYRSAPSLCCGPRSRTRKPTLNEVLVGQAQRQEAIVSTSIPGLSLLPSDLDPAGAEAELPKVDNWQQGLSRVLISLDSVCDAAIIDTPPGWRTPLQRTERCYGGVIVTCLPEVHRLETSATASCGRTQRSARSRPPCIAPSP